MRRKLLRVAGEGSQGACVVCKTQGDCAACDSTGDCSECEGAGTYLECEGQLIPVILPPANRQGGGNGGRRTKTLREGANDRGTG